MVNLENKGFPVEILISTMYRTSLSFLHDMFPNGKYSNYKILIVNQTSEKELLISNENNVRVINSFERGLARSRNQAIQNAESDFCLFSDDDVTYFEGFDSVIENAFKKHPDAHIITYQMVNESGMLYSVYPDVIVHNRKTVSTVNSVVISFDRKKILASSVFFNEIFGLGSIFETADEYVFLRSALRKNLNVFFEPKTILKHPDFSSGKAVGSNKIVFARSAVFYKYNGAITYFKLIWHLLLLIKNNDLGINQFFEKYQQGLKGIGKYKSILKMGLETRQS
ncbi:hypothetical protein GCM10007962_19820 [Yeosuana aromativorans]|uniref:Glycosyltransferase 2-like domain-containing protein n=1 Tax=Yeosuana aromativorans TaxID=288019 RepID=A0A8J3BJH2_9FLAO|nr:glycosyltransferase family 2 protein [Yeosuana aromativorans]GGK25566.1 hypothetical protein GCM10007962_19820 [Yeosuana aromativorans]